MFPLRFTELSKNADALGFHRKNLGSKQTISSIDKSEEMEAYLPGDGKDTRRRKGLRENFY